MRAFRLALGRAGEGFAGASQWEITARVMPSLGPPPRAFTRRIAACFGVPPHYPATQAYAAGLVVSRCVEIAGGSDQKRLRAAAATLDCTTLYGRFRINPVTGVHIGHEVLLAKWVGGRRRVIQARAA